MATINPGIAVENGTIHYQLTGENPVLEWITGTALVPVRERLSEDEALRRIGADPGPWPQVTPARCEALERRAQRAER